MAASRTFSRSSITQRATRLTAPCTGNGHEFIVRMLREAEARAGLSGRGDDTIAPNGSGSSSSSSSSRTEGLSRRSEDGLRSLARRPRRLSDKASKQTRAVSVAAGQVGELPVPADAGARGHDGKPQVRTGRAPSVLAHSTSPAREEGLISVA